MDEATRRAEALDSIFKTIDVAREQHKELLEKIKDVYPGLELEHFDAHHIPFLKNTKSTEEADLWFVIQHLRKYSVLLGHMTQESQSDEEYRLHLLQAKWNVDQLLNSAIIMSEMLTEGRDETDEALPEELKAEFSRSRRQRRDILTVRDYGEFLSFTEGVLSQYRD